MNAIWHIVCGGFCPHYSKFTQLCKSFSFHQKAVLIDDGDMSNLSPAPPIIYSSCPAYHLCSCSSPVSELDCDRCSTVPQRLGPEQRCQSQHPLLRGAEQDKCQKKPPGGKETLCSSPTQQKIQSACTTYPPPSPSPWDKLKPATTITWCKYPLTPA